MSIITDVTRMYLTRSVRPFTFQNEYDKTLPFAECDGLGLYVHIPFCKSTCDFCPYCKVLYSQEQSDKYVDALIREIHLVGGQYDGKKTATSLYFGGGTPALVYDRIGEIIGALKEHFIITEGIGAELHPDNVTIETLQALRDAGVSKISIGIQSFCDKHQKILGRKPLDTEKLQAALKAVPFETVSMDLIFALPEQTYDELCTDMETAFALGANHVAIYPFIDFTFTKSPIRAMPKRKKRALLDAITAYCAERGYQRDSIWTFSNEPNAKYSSMTRENFLGFGCSATSLLKEQFKINTFDVDAYCERIDNGELATSLTVRFKGRQRMVYWLFWTAYSTKVNADDFERFFGVPLKQAYGFELWVAKHFGFITEKNGIYEMTPKGAFYYHYYENFYTLAYIDKMWGIMRDQAFPEHIKL